MIKLIAFDYGGVLGTEADAWTSTFKKVLEISNLSLAQMNQIWEKHWPLVSTGQEEIESYWQDAAQKSGINPNTLREVYNTSITINEDVLNFAKSLKPNHTLIIISNDTKDWMQAKIKRFMLDKIFDKIYCSADLGIRKPSQEVFQLVLKDQHIKPNEMLLIDNQENNIESASALGILTLLFSNQSHTISDIKKSYKNIIRNIK